MDCDQVKKRRKLAMLFNDLPSFGLASIGAFLSFAEAHKAARTCKSNEKIKTIMGGWRRGVVGAKAARHRKGTVDYSFSDDYFKAQISALRLCERLDLLAVRFCRAAILKPLWTHVAPFLKVLKLGRIKNSENLMDICRMLLSLQCLEQFHFLGHKGGADLPIPHMPLLAWRKFLSFLPVSLKTLALDSLDAPMLEELTLTMTQDDRLPALVELYLFYMRLFSLEDAEYLRLMLRTPTGRRLKRLSLQMDGNETDEYAWFMISHVLDIDDPSPLRRDLLPSLEALSLGAIDWTALGKCLLDPKKFPNLMEVGLVGVKLDEDLKVRIRPGDDYWYDGPIDGDAHPYYVNNVYEAGLDCSKLWFDKVIPRRPALRPWEQEHLVSFRPGKLEDEYDGLVRELLMHLSQPLAVNRRSSIGALDIHNMAMDDSKCQLLATTVATGDLLSLRLLSFVVSDGACSAQSLVSLGQVLHHGNLPALVTLSLSMMIGCENGIGGFPPLDWQAFFSAIPKAGLCRVATFESNGQHSEAFHTPGPIYNGLADLGPQAAIFDHVSSITLSGSPIPEDTIAAPYLEESSRS